MDWIVVAGLISFGLVLMTIELIFIPGTTFVGLIGFSIYVYGIYQSFESFGTTIGWVVLVSTGLITIAFTVYSLKSKAWERFALNGANKAKVNEDFSPQLIAGQVGKTVSAIKPIGKAEFDNEQFEVRSDGNYIEENQAVRVLKIDNSRIFVEPINS